MSLPRPTTWQLTQSGSRSCPSCSSVAKACACSLARQTFMAAAWQLPHFSLPENALPGRRGILSSRFSFVTRLRYVGKAPPPPCRRAPPARGSRPTPRRSRPPRHTIRTIPFPCSPGVARAQSPSRSRPRGRTARGAVGDEPQGGLGAGEGAGGGEVAVEKQHGREPLRLPPPRPADAPPRRASRPPRRSSRIRSAAASPRRRGTAPPRARDRRARVALGRRLVETSRPPESLSRCHRQRSRPPP